MAGDCKYLYDGVREAIVRQSDGYGETKTMRSITTLLCAAAVTTLAASAAFGWGAVAVDDADGYGPTEVGYALVTQAGSRTTAGNQAMNECRNEGNDHCVLALTFQGCGAYASSRTDLGVGTGPTLQSAEQKALADCGGK